MPPAVEESRVVASPPRGGLPAYLRLLPQHRLLLCTQCGICYVRQNYERHLLKTHRLTGKAKRSIVECLASADIAEYKLEVQLPTSRLPAILGLPVFQGYACNSVDCLHLTTSEQLIKKHCKKNHDHSYPRDKDAASVVQLQTFFSKTPKYFQVTSASANDASTLTTPLDPHPLANTPTSDARSILNSRYQLAQSSSQARQHAEPQHISEITPWLRVTQFHLHKATFGEVDDFQGSFCIPAGADDESLSLICESVDRLIRHGLDRVQHDQTGKRLHRLDAQLLNSFQAGVTVQDPFQRLDRAHSVNTYSTLFQQLICYFYRLTNDYFGLAVFRETKSQRDCSIALLEEATRQCDDRDSEADSAKEAPGSHADSEATDNICSGNSRARLRRQQAIDQERIQQPNKEKLDRLTLAFCLSLIQHSLDQSTFDSAILSFCAVLAWDSGKKSWRKDLGNYSSSLSKLVYVSQLLILLHCDDLVTSGQHHTLADAIVAQRDLWLQNTSRGPIGEVQSWRLYARGTAKTTVGVAQIRWHQDGVTLVYGDITYKVSYLRDELTYCLAEARRIFAQDLCLGLPDIPVYPPHDLVDNWDEAAAAKSFLDDVRNADCLNGGNTWIYDRVFSSPELLQAALYKNEVGDWPVQADFAYQYEAAVQHFLEFMMTLIHKGSGQPSRRPEMLGLRWQNVAGDKRNLFIHDGYLLFILNYHKSLSQTHGSRYPVRFLLPEVGELLVQFLVLVQPFRRWLSQETHIPARVTEYLWSDSKGVWKDDRMTRLVKRNSLLSIGVATHIQAWRQIAVGMAIKLFSGSRYQGDFDRPGDPDDDDEGRPIAVGGGGVAGEMPDVFHYQTTHAPRTGNLCYGGTINFRDGLTDAGLQEYLLASQMWHQLCLHPPSPSRERDRRLPVGLSASQQSLPMLSTATAALSPPLSSSSAFCASLKHRPPSLTSDAPLPKRMAVRRTPQRHRRRWTAAEAMTALRSLFGPDATYSSPAQCRMIEEIVSGRGEVVAALATGEGKSLAFMLPSRLVQAGTTVVILPLVVLKQDMIRRCTQAGLSFMVWDRHGEHTRYDGCPLIFVSAEAAVLSPFRSFLAGLDSREGLDRVVLDESHLILTASDYRPKLKLIKHLRALRCQFVFLSGTLPPILMPTFCQRLCLFNPEVIRSDQTFRRDLQYAVVFVQPEPETSFLQSAIRGIQIALQDPTTRDDAAARVIVYARTRGTAKEIATALHADAYYSDSGTVDEKAAVLTRWIDGSHPVMVATSAFGMAVDYPRVAAVFHVDVPTNAIDFAQEVGRLGRDGRGGQSTVILPRGASASPSPELENLLPVTEQVMHTYIQQPRCHAAILSWFLDGTPWYCDSVDVRRRCSRCRRLGLRTTDSAPEETPVWLGAKQRKRMAIDDDRAGSDGPDSLLSSDDECRVGPAMLRQHIRDDARDQEQYVRRLEATQGCCMICRLLRSVGIRRDQEMWHGLDACRHPRKPNFFHAKKAAINKGKQQGSGWLAMYTACFGCGNPQGVCDVQGSGGCQFPDIVFPTSWAIFHRPLPFGKTLEQWTGRAFLTEESWMTWLGQEREVHGLQATNAMWVTDCVLREISG
jgi:Orsellinic acid/F9775 biosynthesis cluster protein D/DEAD/DEAH box helicase/Helicase conserved C-terminal domain